MAIASLRDCHIDIQGNTRSTGQPRAFPYPHGQGDRIYRQRGRPRGNTPGAIDVSDRAMDIGDYMFSHRIEYGLKRRPCFRGPVIAMEPPHRINFDISGLQRQSGCGTPHKTGCLVGAVSTAHFRQRPIRGQGCASRHSGAVFGNFGASSECRVGRLYSRS